MARLASTSRKMRRSRDAATTAAALSSHTNSGSVLVENLLSAHDLYNQLGDSAAALDELRRDDSGTKASAYNELILQHLVNAASSSATNCGGSMTNKGSGNNNGSTAVAVNDDPEGFIRQLQQMEDLCTVSEHPWVSHRKLRRNGLICAYNRALVYFSSKDLDRCSQVLLEKLRDWIVVVPTVVAGGTTTTTTAAAGSSLSSSSAAAKNPPQPPPPSGGGGGTADDLVACRMGLLLLECILCKTVGRHSGLDQAARELRSPKVPDIIAWLEKLQKDKDVQLKFLFPVFKSRVAVAALEDSKHVDSQIRAARKDIKTAMEVFQHKLRPEPTESIAAYSGESGEDNFTNNNNGTATATTNGGGSATATSNGTALPPPTTTSLRDSSSSLSPPSTIVVQKLNQAALSLKAHLEQLKGNTKKSLILCTEASTPNLQPSASSFSVSASSATTTTAATASSSLYHQDYLHSNNLAVVYETNDRRQLALYSLAKSLRASEHAEWFAADGTAQYDHRLSVLHNVAIIALRARRYESAYECLAACLTGDIHSVFRQRTTTWLRLAEACIGIHSVIMTDNMTASPKYSALVGPHGEIQGIKVNSNLFFDDAPVISERLASKVGSPEDLAQVKRNPLLRARAALTLVLSRCGGGGSSSNNNNDGDDTATNPDGEKLDADTIASARLSFAFVNLAFGDFPEALAAARQTLAMPSTSALPRLHDRHVATARMYAAEACCRLGDYADAMAYLHGDNKDDPYFYQLASQLSGVTLETASGSKKGKRCLAKTQAIVLSSACAIAAAMGDPTAKQLAHSANSMDSSRTYARRALVYTLLREGNLSSSLNMLLTLR